MILLDTDHLYQSRKLTHRARSASEGSESGSEELLVWQGDRAEPSLALRAHFNAREVYTANRQDFEKIPGLRFANWLDE